MAKKHSMDEAFATEELLMLHRYMHIKRSRRQTDPEPIPPVLEHGELLNPTIPEFQKWTPPSLNMIRTIVTNRDFSKKIKTECLHYRS